MGFDRGVGVFSAGRNRGGLVGWQTLELQKLGVAQCPEVLPDRVHEPLDRGRFLHPRHREQVEVSL